jgi:hypothetical protein
VGDLTGKTRGFEKISGVKKKNKKKTKKTIKKKCQN